MPTSFDLPGHAHELTFSCYQSYPLLDSDQTRCWLADAFNRVRVSHDVAIGGYVFMPEHVHLIVRPRKPSYDMGEIRKAIKHPVSRTALGWLDHNAPDFVPKLTRRPGRKTERLFWQSGGGYDRIIDNRDTLQRMIEYIHHNPVRRGLVKQATDWQWSSARWYLLGEVGPVTVDPIDW